MRENTLYMTLFILIVLAAALLISLIVRIIAAIFSKQKKPMRGFFIAAIAFCLSAVLTALTRLFQSAEVITSEGDNAVPLYQNLFSWLLPLTLFLLVWSIWLFIAGRRKQRGEETGKAVKILSALLPAVILVGLLVPVTFHGMQLGSDIAADQRQYNTYLDYVYALDDGDYDTAVALFHQEMETPTRHNNNYHYHAQQHLLRMERQYRDGEITYSAFEAAMQEMMEFGGKRALEAEGSMENCAQYIELDKALEQGDASLRDGDYEAAARIYHDVQKTINIFDNDAVAVRIDRAAEKLAEANDYAMTLASNLEADKKYEEAAELLRDYYYAVMGVDYLIFDDMPYTIREKYKEIHISWAKALADAQEYGQAIRTLLKVQNAKLNDAADDAFEEQLLAYKELYYPVIVASITELEDEGQPSDALNLLLAEAECFNIGSRSFNIKGRNEELSINYRMMVNKAMEHCGFVWLFDLPIADRKDGHGFERGYEEGSSLYTISLDGYYGGFVEYALHGEYSFMEGQYGRRTPVFYLDGVRADDACFTDGRFHIPLDSVSTLRIEAEYFSTGIPFSDVVYLSNVMLG